jgi:mono/diheme cytochrome c family protein
MIRLASANAVAVVSFVGAMLSTPSGGAVAAETQAQRGKYLVSILPCTDCHTPGTFLGKPDMARYLGGSEVGFEVPGLGIFYGPNITPDDETGLGKWTKEQIATAITEGKRPDGRILAPPMPVESFKNLKHSDALAIAAYLKTLPPIKNKVAGPFGPTEKPTSFVYQVLPPDKYTPTPPHPGPAAPAK